MPVETDNGSLPSSAEAITKFLRAGGENTKRKLDFASQLWSSKEKYFVPGKDELLLDWITTEMFNQSKGEQSER